MTPGTGIIGSTHDFSGGGKGTACVVCHVSGRQAAQNAFWGQAKGLTYSWLGTRSTVAGTRLPLVRPGTGGPSGLCLSCHDGTVAAGDASLGRGLSSLRGRAVALAGNLAGNHPISVPYPAGGVPNVYNGVVTGGALQSDHYVSDPTRSGIVLYQDNGDGTVSSVRDGIQSGSNGIECSSCHDVHNGPGVQDKHLLRGKLAGSGPDYICLKCHML